jgi:small subunit ribosomal protein S18
MARRRQEPQKALKAHPKALRARPNPLATAKITSIDYKDTNLLRTFISDRGKIRSLRVTHVSARQQRQIASAVKNAREMALLPCSSAGSGKRSGPGGAAHTD